VIAKDSSLVMDLVNHLLQLLNYGLLYDEKGQGKEKKFTPRPLVLSATAALGEAMQTDEMAGVVEEHYALIFGSLLLRMGTSQGQPEALKVIAEAFNRRPSRRSSRPRTPGPASTAPSTPTSSLRSPPSWARSTPSTSPPLYRFLLPFMKGNYPGHRVVAACTLAERYEVLPCGSPAGAAPARPRGWSEPSQPSLSQSSAPGVEEGTTVAAHLEEKKRKIEELAARPEIYELLARSVGEKNLIPSISCFSPLTTHALARALCSCAWPWLIMPFGFAFPSTWHLGP